MLTTRPEASEDELEPDTSTRQDWWADARCNDQNATLTGMFFSDELQDIAKAKAICARVPRARPVPRRGHRAA